MKKKCIKPKEENIQNGEGFKGDARDLTKWVGAIVGRYKKIRTTVHQNRFSLDTSSCIACHGLSEAI